MNVTAPYPAKRAIDHLVLPVQDLDAAGDLYEGMGFKVGARNRHPWGTENRLIQFDGCFLELISVGAGAAIKPHRPGFFSFGAFVRDFLAGGHEGFGMLVLRSSDAAGDKVRFDAAGIGGFETFFFERRARSPDGQDVRVAFTLAFAATPALPDAGFFVCEQHEPQNFWNPAFQVHPNGATGLARMTLLAPDPASAAPFFSAFADADPALSVASTGGGFALGTPNGDIEVLRADGQAAGVGGGRLVSFTVRADPERLAECLGRDSVGFKRLYGSIAVPAFGTLVIFESTGP